MFRLQISIRGIPTGRIPTGRIPTGRIRTGCIRNVGKRRRFGNNLAT